MSDREYLVHQAIAGTMPWLNRVFEEFRIHHEEHDVPMKVHKSIEDKERKAATKNVTIVVEARKRKGATMPKVITNMQKTRDASIAASADASAAASANDDEEVAENVGGASGSAAARTGGERSAASLDLGGDDLVDTALQGADGGLAADPSAMAPMPSILGDETSSSEGDGTGGGDASLPREGEAAGNGIHRPAAGLDEVFEDEVEASAPVALS